MLADFKSSLSVSAIITTKGNWVYVSRMLRSLEAQSTKVNEIILVVDSNNNPPKEIFDSNAAEKPIVIHVNEISKGANYCRNLGVRLAKSEFVVLLDDDDECLPHKIEKQILSIQQSPNPTRCVSLCQVFLEYQGKMRICPSRFYEDTNQNAGDFLFSRTQLRAGEGLVQTSMIACAKSLIQEVPFDESLIKHHDIDWFLRVTRAKDVCVVWVKEPLVIWHATSSPSVGKIFSWEFSLNWILSYRHEMSKVAVGGFIVSQLISQISFIKTPFLFLRLLFALFQYGKLNFTLLKLICVYFFFDQKARHKLAKFKIS